jgi:hypothetical protein
MKVYKDGKEVKGASVSYYATGTPSHVTVDGVDYDPSAYELKDEEPTKKTRTAPDSKQNNDNILSTKDLSRK